MDSVIKDTRTCYWKSYLDVFSDKEGHDYIEIVEWSNTEGFDVEISSSNKSLDNKFSISRAQMDALLTIFCKVKDEESFEEQ